MNRFVAKSLIAAPALAVLALVGCEDKPAEPPAKQTTQPAPKPAASGAAQPAKSPDESGAASAITWKKPDAWEQVDHPSPMRKATYKVTKAEGDPEDGEMSVTQVGGGIDANIERWEGQFGGAEAKITKKQAGGLEVTVVEIAGTFAGGGGPMMGGGGEPKKDWMMLAAIVPTQPQPHFFKLTGPKKTLEAARGDFDALVDSIAGK